MSSLSHLLKCPKHWKILLQPQCMNATTKLFKSTTPNHYDIVIAGGGMVGTTLACTLGQNAYLSNKNILLLEAADEKPIKVSSKYSNRVSSLNPGTINLLCEIGAWKHITETRCAPVKQLQVWDGVSDAMITFNHENSEDYVSYIVENDVLLSATNRVMKDIKNVQVLYKAKIKQYNLPDHEHDKVSLCMENGDEITCDLLLGCDGANSQVRKTMQVHYLSWNYDQMGVVATLQFAEKSTNDTAWQRFIPTGPIALLPLTDELSSLVWSTTPQHAKHLLQLTDDEFVEALNESLWKSFKTNSIVEQVTHGFSNFWRALNCPSDIMRQLPPKICGCQEKSRAAFPLGFGHASNYIGKGVVLVGDAAHRIHPLAGQGVNLGFGDIATLNKVISKAIYSGSTITDMCYLKEYETERQRHNIPTMLAVEGLHRLYNTEFLPLVLLRSLGLQATHAINPLKKAIISHAAS
ncbi:ubiquinone biosynthesis monooxygenase COQ6, mitochondrial [Aethina tumida]|uniref:ubiquinone biosynthesis monooxygenase COQ6, mitochondrial n=1 Tax=Aethina tumida TaxID=116153 RepID=UPI002148619C|nr:ubiquinone biosynthesis monooxygenase COQ6, mitochondrial [Aethina tumida]